MCSVRAEIIFVARFVARAQNLCAAEGVLRFPAGQACMLRRVKVCVESIVLPWSGLVIHRAFGAGREGVLIRVLCGLLQLRPPKALPRRPTGNNILLATKTVFARTKNPLCDKDCFVRVNTPFDTDRFLFEARLVRTNTLFVACF